MKDKHSFTIWSWEQESKEVFFCMDDDKYTAYHPNYHMFKNKVFNHKKFNLFPMKKYKITIEQVKG